MRTIFQNCTLLDGTEQMSPRPGTDVAIENDIITLYDSNETPKTIYSKIT